VISALANCEGQTIQFIRLAAPVSSIGESQSDLLHKRNFSTFLRLITYLVLPKGVTEIAIHLAAFKQGDESWQPFANIDV
jgi:hypothetical protein